MDPEIPLDSRAVIHLRRSRGPALLFALRTPGPIYDTNEVAQRADAFVGWGGRAWRAPARVGVDVGGTFTDVVLIDDAGAIHTWKLPSTPDDFSRGVIDGVTAVLSRARRLPGRRPRRGPRQHRRHERDPRAARRADRPAHHRGLPRRPGTAPAADAAPLRHDLAEAAAGGRAPAAARGAASASASTAPSCAPLDVDAARREAQTLVDEGVEAIAVSLLHAYANPSHERAIGELLEREFPDLWVSLSHRVLPIIREYERTSTTVLNAYVQPTVASYLGALRRQLDGAGVAGPLLIMQSNGGIMASAAAAARPAYIVESGPAAGVIAGAELARRARARFRHHLRHGRHDRQGVARRGRPAALHRRVRGRGRDLREQPALERRRVRAERPVHRPRGGRRGRRQPRLARPGRCPQGRPSLRGRRSGPGLLRPRRRSADGDRREPAARLPEPGGAARRRDAARRRPGARGLRARRRRAARAGRARRGARRPRAREREHDPRDQGGVRAAGPRPARLHARRVRRQRPDPRRLAGAGVGHSPRARAAAARASSRPWACSRRGSSSTRRRRTCAESRDLSLASCGPRSPRSRRRRAPVSGRTRLAPAPGPSSSSGSSRCATSARGSSCRWRCPTSRARTARRPEPAALGERLTAAFDAEHERTYGHRTGNAAEIVHLRVVLREADPPPFPDAPLAATPSRAPRRVPPTSGSDSGRSRRPSSVAATSARIPWPGRSSWRTTTPRRSCRPTSRSAATPPTTC